MDLQHGIIRGNTLESDVRMPTNACETAGVTELVRQASAFTLLGAADNAYLVSELTSFFCQGMYVKAR